MKEFKRFPELFYDRKKETKKYTTLLQKEAKEWFEDNFSATFGSTTRIGCEKIFTWHFTCGMLSFGIPSLGTYHYKFIIKMIHFELWKTKEWREGFKYGRFCDKTEPKHTNDNYRDANPYSEIKFYSNDAWDAGYVMGISNYSFKKYLHKLKNKTK